MNWFVYILRCSDDTFYTGITNDLEQRVRTHNAKKGARYTSGRLPVALVWFEKTLDKSHALRRELEIKSWSKKKKELLLRSGKLSA